MKDLHTSGQSMQLLEKIGKAPYAFLTIICAVIAVKTLSSDFLSIDDLSLIVNNPHLNFSWTNLLAVVTRPLGQIHNPDFYPQTKFVYYRPALNLFYMFNASLWGINPVGFHISNLALHLATTILLYRIALRLLDGNVLVSLFLAAFFCVHPVHNELIGRVAMNENLLGFFMALTLMFYLQGDKKLSLSAFVLALLTKESAIMLPFVLLLFESTDNRLRIAAKNLLPFGIAIGIYLAGRAVVVGTPETSFDANWVEHILTAFSSLAVYLRLLVFPYPLSIYYPVFKLVSPFQPELVLGASVLLLIGCFVCRRTTDRLQINLLAGTIILLAPVIFNANRLILGLDRAFVAERQLYVPALLFSLFIGSLLVKVSVTMKFRSTILIPAAVLLLFIPLMYCNIKAAAFWQNSENVTGIFSRDFPDSSLAHKTMGSALLEKGDLDGSLAQFMLALPKSDSPELSKPERFLPPQSKSKFNGSKTVLERIDIAAYKPWYADIHFNIGQIYLKKNDPEAAVRKFKTVLVMQPHSVDAHAALADIYLKKGLFKEASREYKLALKDIDALRAAN